MAGWITFLWFVGLVGALGVEGFLLVIQFVPSFDSVDVQTYDITKTCAVIAGGLGIVAALLSVATWEAQSRIVAAGLLLLSLIPALHTTLGDRSLRLAAASRTPGSDLPDFLASYPDTPVDEIVDVLLKDDDPVFAVGGFMRGENRSLDPYRSAALKAMLLRVDKMKMPYKSKAYRRLLQATERSYRNHPLRQLLALRAVRANWNAMNAKKRAALPPGTKIMIGWLLAAEKGRRPLTIRLVQRDLSLPQLRQKDFVAVCYFRGNFRRLGFIFSEGSKRASLTLQLTRSGILEQRTFVWESTKRRSIFQIPNYTISATLTDNKQKRQLYRNTVILDRNMFKYISKRKHDSDLVLQRELYSKAASSICYQLSRDFYSSTLFGR